MARFLLAFFFLSLLTPLVHAGDPIDKISKQLIRGAKKFKDKRIAIFTFPYHNGKISSGSSIISERLTTNLVNRGLNLVERRLLQKVLEEQKLGETGILDPSLVQDIGSVLGVEIIVTGTLIDLENGKTEINARMIESETGEVLSAAIAKMKRYWADRPHDPVRRARLTQPKKKAVVDPETLVEEKYEKPKVDTTVYKPKIETPGKTLKLSNENFPAGRRNYNSYDDEPSQYERGYRRGQEDAYDEVDDYEYGYEKKKSYGSKRKYKKKDYNKYDYYSPKVKFPANTAATKTNYDTNVITANEF